MRAHINIGSNIGDRAALLERAVADIQHALQAPVRCSEVIETEPWGFSSPHPFLNIGIMVDTDLSPLQLFDKLMEIQQAIDGSSHRTSLGDYADRAIDIDLIAVDQVVLSTPRLTLPHPRMHLRRFVLEPMLALDPHWCHPILHLTPSQLLADCAE